MQSGGHAGSVPVVLAWSDQARSLLLSRSGPVRERTGAGRETMLQILWVIAAILIVIWLVGLFVHLLGAFIHILLVLAIIALIIGFITRNT